MLDEIVTFRVTMDHIRLLKRMNVSWEDAEFGAPSIDPKRPYGNSDVLLDMADILGIKPEGEEEWEPSNAETAWMSQLHKETQTVLQIVLSTGKMRIGPYECAKYSNDWKEAE